MMVMQTAGMEEKVE